MRRHLFVIDSWDKIHPFTDTSFAFMLEAQTRGDEVYTCQIEHLSVHQGKGHAFVCQTQVEAPSHVGEGYYSCLSQRSMAFDDFHYIWMRKDPPVDRAFIYATMLLDCHDKSRTKVINNPTSLRIVNEKLWMLPYMHSFMPPTVVSSDTRTLLNAASRFGKTVLKPVYGRGGFGVMVFEQQDRNLPASIELLTEEGKVPIIAQSYIAGAHKGDKRILLFNGKPVGAVNRVPTLHDNRANLHIGGSAEKTTITKREESIIQALAPHLERLGLYFVGIDVIDGYLTEVNVTSPTGALEIDRLEKRTGNKTVAAQVLEAL